jgi:multidrug resistance efflux pump
MPLAAVGDTVCRGDTLMILRSTLNEGLLAEAKSELKRAEAERKLLISDPKMEEIDTKLSEVKQAEAIYESARKEYNRIKQMHAKGLISDDELEKSAADFNVAYQGWQSKMNELELLKSAPKAEEVERVDADIERLRARVAYLQSQADASLIISPFTGAMVGTTNGNEVFRLARTESLMVEIGLPEGDLDILTTGSEMELRVAAFPGKPIKGEVLKLKLSPELMAVAAVANDGSLLPEMSGYAKVDCGDSSLAYLLFRKLTRFFRLEVWSWT